MPQRSFDKMLGLYCIFCFRIKNIGASSMYLSKFRFPVRFWLRHIIRDCWIFSTKLALITNSFNNIYNTSTIKTNHHTQFIWTLNDKNFHKLIEKKNINNQINWKICLHVCLILNILIRMYNVYNLYCLWLSTIILISHNSNYSPLQHHRAPPSTI